MKITFVISSLLSGGAERVLVNMANYWAEHGHEITVVTQAPLGADFYSIDYRIQRISLNTLIPSNNFFEALFHNIKRIIKLRQTITRIKPQVIISFMTDQNIMAILAAIGLKIPVIISEHTDPKKYSPGVIWSYLRNFLYSLADTLIVLSKDNLDWFRTKVRCSIKVIPNAAIKPNFKGSNGFLAERLGLPDNTHFVISLGRLVESKGFDLLLKAWAQIIPSIQNWHLIILGDGPLKNELLLLIDQLGINKEVSLPGLVKEPPEYLQQADLFVLSSRFEGFPLALIEAMSCGLPVIVTDCTQSIAEIVRSGVDGLLVPNENISALSQAILKVITNETLRLSMASNSVEILDRYSMEKVMGMWETLIQGILGINQFD